MAVPSLPLNARKPSCVRWENATRSLAGVCLLPPFVPSTGRSCLPPTPWKKGSPSPTSDRRAPTPTRPPATNLVPAWNTFPRRASATSSPRWQKATQISAWSRLRTPAKEPSPIRLMSSWTPSRKSARRFSCAWSRTSSPSARAKRSKKSTPIRSRSASVASGCAPISLRQKSSLPPATPAPHSTPPRNRARQPSRGSSPRNSTA